MKSKLFTSVLIYIGITLLLFTSQWVVQSELFSEIDFYYPLWGIYLFHSCFAAVIYFTVKAVHGILPDKAGLAFLALSGFKMLGAILFLVPLIQSELADPIPAVFSFFVPYFLYLLIEVILVIKLLK
ncbi:hypothetical protein [Galbibacter sp.]|jgi:hypothetical protein|uniref:hypothetical protein n=1 Tax=Galbibacter sp. TaxID=2918471 RepID=UPI003A8F65E0